MTADRRWTLLGVVLLLVAVGTDLLLHPHAALPVGSTGIFGAMLVGGIALEVVSGFVTAPSTTLTNWTMATGDSLNVRPVPTPDTPIRLLGLWYQNQVAGIGVLRSPRMHDNVQGIRNRILTADVFGLYPFRFPQPLYSQDALVSQQSGSAVGGQIESGSLLIQYDNIQGVAGRYLSPDDVMKRARHLSAVELAITAGAGGGYTGARAINADFDNFKPNTDYALIGYLVNAQCCTVGWRGVDTGNLRVGGPGITTERHITDRWFMRLSEYYGLPLVPVFNSAARGAVLVDVVQSQAAAAVTVISYLVELAPAI